MAIEYAIEVTPGTEIIEATNYSILITFIRYEGDPDPLVQTYTGNMS